jgi:hypothetical protein
VLQERQGQRAAKHQLLQEEGPEVTNTLVRAMEGNQEWWYQSDVSISDMLLQVHGSSAALVVGLSKHFSCMQ